MGVALMAGEVNIDGMNLGIQVIILIVSVALIAFFSSSEAALISVNKFRIQHMAQQGNKAAQAVSRVASNHEKFFATILLTENAFIIMASSIGTALAITILGSGGVAIAVATLISTIVIVMFGEIAPKALAAQWAERWSLIVGRIIEIVMKIETYVIFLFTLLPRLLLWFMGGRVVLQTPSVTEGELRMLVDIGRAEGMLEHSDAELIENVFRFGDRQLREVMTPRTEMVCLEKGATLEEFLRLYQEHAHTRFPVYEASMDNVLGTVSVKDVVLAMADSNLEPHYDVTQLSRQTYFVPETKLIGDLFRELRETGYQLVMVADEYGGIAGLATLKQMVEEVVGHVVEEGVGVEEEVQVINVSTYQVDAGMAVDEANTQLALGIPEGDYETLAGFLLTRLGRIPQEGERLYHNGFLVEITEMKGVKIEQLRVTRVASASTGNGQ